MYIVHMYCLTHAYCTLRIEPRQRHNYNGGGGGSSGVGGGHRACGSGHSSAVQVKSTDFVWKKESIHLYMVIISKKHTTQKTVKFLIVHVTFNS